ncbi:hypothetical protein KIW84_065532 [Lathyrus oleraceus]|uniref:Retroviral polymerase SH3-like domain-containing protein n=1 Tax=Pisum sativum TaxID=3888 RepID=A0A9D4WHF1_PEA|nr:hypothetical protein KIW84_065532 [Pisum sativum]
MKLQFGASKHSVLGLVGITSIGRFVGIGSLCSEWSDSDMAAGVTAATRIEAEGKRIEWFSCSAAVVQSTHSKAYRLYNPVTQKIIISRDVVFDESKTWKWTVNSTREYISVTDDEVEEEKHDAPSSSIVTDSPSAPSPNSQVEVEDGASNEPKPQRIRRRPTWMQDYEISGINQIDDPVSHFALFPDHDPDGVIDVIYCKSEEQIADIMTKPLETAVFEKLRSMLGVCSGKEVVPMIEV